MWSWLVSLWLILSLTIPCELVMLVRSSMDLDVVALFSTIDLLLLLLLWRIIVVTGSWSTDSVILVVMLDLSNVVRTVLFGESLVLFVLFSESVVATVSLILSIDSLVKALNVSPWGGVWVISVDGVTWEAEVPWSPELFSSFNNVASVVSGVVSLLVLFTVGTVYNIGKM